MAMHAAAWGADANLQAMMPARTTTASQPPKGGEAEQQTLIESCVDVITRLHTMEPPATAGAPHPDERISLMRQPLRVLASGRALSRVTEPDVDGGGNDVTGPPDRGGNLAAVIIEATGGLGPELRPEAVYDATLYAEAAERAGLIEGTPLAAFNWTARDEAPEAGDGGRRLGPRSAATAALAMLLTRWRKRGRARRQATRRGEAVTAGRHPGRPPARDPAAEPAQRER